MKIHKHRHAWKQPSKMVLPYLPAAMYRSSGPESPNVTMFISPVFRSYAKDTFDFLCSTYHFKAVFLEKKLGLYIEFGSISDRIEALTFVSLIAKKFYILKHMVKPFNALISYVGSVSAI